MAGTEFGSECFCGNSIDNGNTPASSGCDMACNGLKADTCGGAGRISVFKKTCARTPDCTTGYGIISSTYVNSLSVCSQMCFNNPNCQSFQFGYPYDTQFKSVPGYCNLYPYAMAVIRAYRPSSDNYCMSFSVYDGTCTF
jgi:hypothetical protein